MDDDDNAWTFRINLKTIQIMLDNIITRMYHINVFLNYCISFEGFDEHNRITMLVVTIKAHRPPSIPETIYTIIDLCTRNVADRKENN